MEISKTITWEDASIIISLKLLILTNSKEKKERGKKENMILETIALTV
jgi:hypothetical protein